MPCHTHTLNLTGITPKTWYGIFWLPCSYRRGVLSEAALALEAEVQAQPGNAEAWRLLGTVHAENDDDQQVSSSSRPPPVSDACIIKSSSWCAQSINLGNGGWSFAALLCRVQGIKACMRRLH